MHESLGFKSRSGFTKSVPYGQAFTDWVLETIAPEGCSKMTAHGIDLDSEAIRDFCAKWKIKELSVFGSILREDLRPDSDVDCA
jgi:hypothetical protein